MNRLLVTFLVNTIVKVIEENGAEILDQIKDWLIELVESRINPPDPGVFSSPKCPDGCDEVCAAIAHDLDDLVAEYGE